MIDDAVLAESPVESGMFEVNVQLPQPIEETFRIKFVFDLRDKKTTSADDRNIAFVLVELRAHHPETGHLAEMREELAEEVARARMRIEDLEVKAGGADRLAAELENKCGELAQCLGHLHAAERTIQERTDWAQRNAAELEALHRQLHALLTTRWARLGRKLRLTPGITTN